MLVVWIPGSPAPPRSKIYPVQGKVTTKCNSCHDKHDTQSILQADRLSYRDHRLKLHSSHNESFNLRHVFGQDHRSQRAESRTPYSSNNYCHKYCHKYIKVWHPAVRALVLVRDLDLFQANPCLQVWNLVLLCQTKTWPMGTSLNPKRRTMDGANWSR